jgi:mRNA-degrading endonuclease RelE of RelBE toxin-antitoxin system
MNKFHVVLTYHAIADLKGIAKNLKAQIHQDLKALEFTPFPSGNFIKRLKGFRPPVYRLRSGDFRILYHIGEKTVTILRLIDRKELERVIKRLKI